MSRRKAIAIDDCKRCMETTTQQVRMSMGCGYEPPASGRVHLTIWQPPRSMDGKHGYSGPNLTVCAGYSANLPEVVEVYLARFHWDKGNVAMDRTPEALLGLILIVDGQHGAVEAWRSVPAGEGGGGQ